jgi:hypothetical protein
MQFWLFASAAVLALLSSLTLLAKSEFYRGGGRILGGLSWVLFGSFLLALSALPASYAPLSWCVVFTGVLTVASGARKFLRRNAQEQKGEL